MTERTPHATLIKFGYPDTVIADYGSWVVLLRPKQATLGALVLVCAEEATAFADISATAFATLPRAIGDVEDRLKTAFAYDKINYLMLMMVDPQVHFHVLPRYGESRDFAGHRFADPGWPGPPDFGQGTTLDDGLTAAFKDVLVAPWTE